MRLLQGCGPCDAAELGRVGMDWRTRRPRDAEDALLGSHSVFEKLCCLPVGGARCFRFGQHKLWFVTSALICKPTLDGDEGRGRHFNSGDSIGKGFGAGVVCHRKLSVHFFLGARSSKAVISKRHSPQPFLFHITIQRLNRFQSVSGRIFSCVEICFRCVWSGLN